MNIILHIGTQKTATSTLQRFFLTNKKNLLSNGIFYLHHTDSKNLNILASHLVFGRYTELRKYINNAIQKSRRNGLDTILMSGESFYAMSAFFLKLYNKKCVDYWHTEKSIIKNLHNCLPDGINIRIVCYFRRQDQFLESMYNQVVKSMVSFPGDINQFYGNINESLNYVAHMDIWADVFGIDNVQVRCYEHAAGNICEDFLADVLNIKNSHKFIKLNARINERINRDVLEYKRIINQIELPFVEKFMTKRVLSTVSKSMNENSRYKICLEPSKRAEILNAFKNGNHRLQSVYKMRIFPELDFQKSLDSWAPYPGLSVEKSIEITMRFLQLRNSFSFKLERFTRSISYLLRTKIKLLTWVLSLSKKLRLLRFIEMPRPKN